MISRTSAHRRWLRDSTRSWVDMGVTLLFAGGARPSSQGRDPGDEERGPPQPPPFDQSVPISTSPATEVSHAPHGVP